MLISISWLLIFMVRASAVLAAQPADIEEQTRRIAAELRCPVCQNLSVADSPSELAQQMRSVIAEQLKQGKTPEQVRDYFISKYGEWVLLAPAPHGFNLVIWILPFGVVAAGTMIAVLLARRWVRKRKPALSTADSGLVERVRRDVARQDAPEQPHGGGESLEAERAKLYGYLKELEFDYETGRISEHDFHQLRPQYENQAALLLEKLDARSRTPTVEKEHDYVRNPARQSAEPPAPTRRTWIVAGSLALMVFGIAVGFLLNQSLRPRTSEQDTLTGDFLTGTANDLPAHLARGRAAFERQEWPQAITAFKIALEVDPNHPEAHSYMGLILVQAGHADGALLAFDRALATDPDFPLALWGKGMLLYRVKEDYAAARQNLEKLVSLTPAGKERSHVQNIIGELADLQKADGGIKPRAGGAGRLQGTVSIAPELKSKIDDKAVLFIIARDAGSTAGPPLAVKRVDRPAFPVAFSLGEENVMIPGKRLTGKVTLSARVDGDRNPTTRSPGDLFGEYNDPVKVGSRKVEIVIDRII